MTSVWLAFVIGKLDLIYEQFSKPGFNRDMIINVKCLHTLYDIFIASIIAEEGRAHPAEVKAWDIWVQFLGLAHASGLTFAKLYVLFVSGIKQQW